MESNLQEAHIPESASTQHVPAHKSGQTIFFIIFVLAVILVTIFSITRHKQSAKKIQTQIPEESTLYLANKDTTPVLFYRYPDLIIDHNTPPRSLGHYAAFGKEYDQKKNPLDFIDFTNLKNPKKLFSFEGHMGIENYLVSDDKRYLLLSFVGGKSDSTNYIYQIDLQSQTSKKIWEHEVRTGTPPYNGGIAHLVSFVPNQYLVFSIIKNAPPPTALPIGVIIKNIQSGEEKILGVVGDVQIDTATKTVSFKKLGKTQALCEQHDPACFATDTYKFVYKPEGDIIKQPLP